MATIQALSKLNDSIQLAERAEMQARALAATLRNVNAEIDSVLLDADLPMNVTVIEKATGNETQLSLRAPIQPESLEIAVDGVPLAANAFTADLNTGLVTLAEPLPQNGKVTAAYTVLGLRAQMEPIAAAVGIDLALVEARKQKYLTAIQWITENFGA